MSEDRPSEVLGALPRTRPHRRSEKRAARPVAENMAAETAPAAQKPPAPKHQRARTPAKQASRPSRTRARPKLRTLPQPAQPAGTPPKPSPRKPPPSTGSDVLGTAIQAAAELAEIGLSVSARAIRHAVSRLPRP